MRYRLKKKANTSTRMRNSGAGTGVGARAGAGAGPEGEEMCERKRKWRGSQVSSKCTCFAVIDHTLDPLESCGYQATEKQGGGGR